MLCELLAKSAIASQALLLVVSNDRPETAGIKRFIENNRLQNNVKHINGMSDKQYQRYELVIAPPTMEGFGLPMAETLWCGCRVVCSDISAFREFGGNSCYYFDLERPSPELTMAMATRRALDNTRRNTNFVNDFSIGNASDNMSLSMVGY
jgi:glycosyltransferase involved in cell wall biosynthesis